MDAYRATPGWSVLVETCPELAPPEDSDEEDWRASLAKVKAQPSITDGVDAASEVPAVSSSPVVASAPVPTLSVYTSRSGPAPRPAAHPPVRLPSLPSSFVPDPPLAASSPAAPDKAASIVLSGGSEDEEEDEVDQEDSEEDEIIDTTAEHEVATAAGVDDTAKALPPPRKSKRATRGSRQMAKDHPSEIWPEDLALGAFRAGPELVVRSSCDVLFPFSYLCSPFS